MGYYNWSEIIPTKSEQELITIVRDRILSKDAIDIAKGELARRRDPQYIKRVKDLDSLYEEWLVKPGNIFDGLCRNCKEPSSFLFTMEKGPRFKISMFFGEAFGFHFLFTPRQMLEFLKLRRNRDGVIGTCLLCGSIMIKCKKCNNIQELEGEFQICSECGKRIDKPENFNNPRNV